MQIQYRRTFSQFVDNYIAGYYSGGTQTLRRTVGGPVLIVIGAVVFSFGADPDMLGGWRFLLRLIGGGAVIYGLFYFLLPAINIFFVWLRRDQFLGPEGSLVTLTLDKDGQKIDMTDPEGDLTIPLTEIRTIHHRSDGAWLLTQSGHMVNIPGDELVQGDYEAFFAAIETILEENEQSF